MRETATGLRMSHWMLLLVALTAGALYTGLLDIHGIAARFATQPEIVQVFRDPDFGRADALILMFSALFIGPLALLLGFSVLFTAFAVLGGFLLPIVRWFRLPEWLANALVLGGVVTVLWLHTDAWLPRSLWCVALFVRACRLAISA